MSDLIQARDAALARGDKALARELYHQLLAAGYRPEEIDAGTATSTVAEDGVGVLVDAEPPASPPSTDPAVVRLWSDRQAFVAELGSVSSPKVGNPKRAKAVQEQIDEIDAEITRLLAVADEKQADEPEPAAEEDVVEEPTAPETTEAPAAPEKAVKPAPKPRKPKGE